MSSIFHQMRDELLAGHPVTGPYSADNAIAADQLNAVNRQRRKPTMTGLEVRGVINDAEFAGLTDANRQLALTLFTAEELDTATDGPDDRLIQFIFGPASATRIALGVARMEDISRGEELGFGEVKESHVAFARTL